MPVPDKGESCFPKALSSREEAPGGTLLPRGTIPGSILLSVSSPPLVASLTLCPVPPLAALVPEAAASSHCLSKLVKQAF